MKNKIKEAGYFLDGKLRSLCGEITPEKRIIWVLVALLTFALVNLYIMFSSIYNLGENAHKKERVGIEIEHIPSPEIVKPIKTRADDTK